MNKPLETAELQKSVIFLHFSVLIFAFVLKLYSAVHKPQNVLLFSQNFVEKMSAAHTMHRAVELRETMLKCSYV